MPRRPLIPEELRHAGAAAPAGATCSAFNILCTRRVGCGVTCFVSVTVCEDLVRYAANKRVPVPDQLLNHISRVVGSRAHDASVSVGSAWQSSTSCPSAPTLGPVGEHSFQLLRVCRPRQDNACTSTVREYVSLYRRPDVTGRPNFPPSSPTANAGPQVVSLQ